jgi:hypothetical protein
MSTGTAATSLLLKRLAVCAPAHKAEDGEKNHRILDPEEWRRSSCLAYQRSDNQYDVSPTLCLAAQAMISVGT